MHHFYRLLIVSVLTASVQGLRLNANRVLASAIAGTFIATPIDFATVSFNGIHNPMVQVAHADARAAQKRTYFRFVPKLIKGRDFYKTDLKQAIDKEDWSVVQKMFEVYVTKYNANDPSQIDATDRYVDSYLLRPLTVFGGSFAERGSSPKARALEEQKVLFAEAMDSLERSVVDRKGPGFFDGIVKAPTGAERKKQASAAYVKGKAALNEYIRLANEGLMLELNKIDGL